MQLTNIFCIYSNVSFNMFLYDRNIEDSKNEFVRSNVDEVEMSLYETI